MKREHLNNVAIIALLGSDPGSDLRGLTCESIATNLTCLVSILI